MRNYELFCAGSNANLPFHCLCNSKNFDDHLVNSLIFCVENFAIIRKIIFEMNILMQIPCFLGEKFAEKKENPSKTLPKIITTAYNIEVLKIFLLSYFEYHKTWLSILRDDNHFSNITKLRGKNTG